MRTILINKSVQSVPYFISSSRTAIQLFTAVFLPALSLTMATSNSAAAPSKPNIIVILTDDQGYADLGVQGVVKDIQTPNIDRMAREGVRCTAGYITAPQCSPSRAGIITGRYQQRFGIDTIPDVPLPLEEITLAERLAAAGYMTGMVGKWHLEPNVIAMEWLKANYPAEADKPRAQRRIPHEAILKYSPAAQGFKEYWWGEMHRAWANFDLEGNSLKPSGQWQTDSRDRLDVQTDAALAFIQRNHDKPFYLHLAYYGPHTPLTATPERLQRFSGERPERRRYALAMLAAIDDGVGRILDSLQHYGIDENTLIFFTSDNGAPLKLTKPDNPIDTDPGGWDGSLNDPWVGEKGMLSEGGIRVPFLVRWKNSLPQGHTYTQPVISLDIAATALAAAGIEKDPILDGVDLLPFFQDQRQNPPHEALYWRFWNQVAVRSGPWKLLAAGPRTVFLFNLETDEHETVNLADKHPDQARKLAGMIQSWARELEPPGMPAPPENGYREANWYRFYFDVELPKP
jgi:arylsulfatase A-like enzyme